MVVTEKNFKEKPTCYIKIQGKSFHGLLDTGTDVSIIGTDNWPKKWPLGPAVITISGLGQADNVNQCLHILPRDPRDRRDIFNLT